MIRTFLLALLLSSLTGAYWAVAANVALDAVSVTSQAARIAVIGIGAIGVSYLSYRLSWRVADGLGWTDGGD